jgi:hypothetical protein
VITEDGYGAGAGTVAFMRACVQDMAEETEVLLHGRLKNKNTDFHDRRD